MLLCIGTGRFHQYLTRFTDTASIIQLLSVYTSARIPVDENMSTNNKKVQHGEQIIYEQLTSLRHVSDNLISPIN